MTTFVDALLSNTVESTSDAVATANLPDRPRPHFERSEITSKRHFILDEISDLNADALGAACEKCSAHFSWGQWLNAGDRMEQMRCHRCDSSIYNEDFCLDPSEETLAEFRKPGYFDRTWYHATTRADWVRGVRGAFGGDFLIHAGDRITAMARADNFHEANGFPYRAGRELEIFLYSFKFRSTRGFRSELFEDMGEDWPEDLGHRTTMRVLANGVSSPARSLLMDRSFRGAGYYNRYEVPGSVSVIAAAKHIQLNTVEVVSLGI